VLTITFPHFKKILIFKELDTAYMKSIAKAFILIFILSGCSELFKDKISGKYYYVNSKNEASEKDYFIFNNDGTYEQSFNNLFTELMNFHEGALNIHGRFEVDSKSDKLYLFPESLLAEGKDTLSILNGNIIYKDAVFKKVNIQHSSSTSTTGVTEKQSEKTEQTTTQQNANDNSNSNGITKDIPQQNNLSIEPPKTESSNSPVKNNTSLNNASSNDLSFMYSFVNKRIKDVPLFNNSLITTRLKNLLGSRFEDLERIYNNSLNNRISAPCNTPQDPNPEDDIAIYLDNKLDRLNSAQIFVSPKKDFFNVNIIINGVPEQFYENGNKSTCFKQMVLE
jgi:hypothetical protein